MARFPYFEALERKVYTDQIFLAALPIEFNLSYPRYASGSGLQTV
jgi:hypothetical protein